VKIAGLREIPAATSFPELARKLLLLHADADGSKVFGATVHHHFELLDRIWPDARYIHLRRDPRDVARSAIHMGWAGNAWGGVPTWTQSFLSWQRLVPIVPPERRLEVSYEDLVADAPRELTRICGFLGVEYEPGMLEIEKDTTYKRPSPKEARSWRQDAGADEIRAMEARLGPLLKLAGYEPSGLPPLAVGPLRRLRLEAANRLGRMRFKQRRFGIGLWLAGWLSERLPSDAFRRWVASRRDPIALKHLK
jgi:hypothetical protein